MQQTHSSSLTREGFLWLPYLLAALLCTSIGITCGDMQEIEGSLTSRLNIDSNNIDPNNSNTNNTNTNSTNTNNANPNTTNPNTTNPNTTNPNTTNPNTTNPNTANPNTTNPNTTNPNTANPNTTNPNSNTACAGLSYTNSIASKIGSRCGGCHFGRTSPNLSDYDRVVANKTALLRTLSPQCTSICMRDYAGSDANTIITWLQDCNAKQN